MKEVLHIIYDIHKGFQEKDSVCGGNSGAQVLCTGESWRAFWKVEGSQDERGYWCRSDRTGFARHEGSMS